MHARTRTRRSVLSHGLTVFCHAHHAGPPPVQPHHRVCISSGFVGVPRPLRDSTRPPMYAWRWRRSTGGFSLRPSGVTKAQSKAPSSACLRRPEFSCLPLDCRPPSALRPPTFQTTALMPSPSSRPHARPSRGSHGVTASSRCPRFMPFLIVRFIPI